MKDNLDDYIEQYYTYNHLNSFLNDDYVVHFFDDINKAIEIKNSDYIYYENDQQEFFGFKKDLNDLSTEQETVVDFYEKDIKEYLKKLDKGFKQVEDDKGNSWYKIDISKDDKNKPLKIFNVIGPLLGAGLVGSTIGTPKKKE